MQFKKIFITGAGGLIGSAVCEELDMRGICFRALLARDESDENLRGLKAAEIHRGDVRDETAMKKLAKGCDAFIHLAALNRLWHRPAKDFYDINVEGTMNACRAALDAKVRLFIHTSSCEVMGPAHEGPLADERGPLSLRRLKGHYERSKYLAEKAVADCLKEGLPAIVIRPTAVVGPKDIHGTPPGRLIRKFLSGEIHAYYDTGINVVDSKDIAKALLAALSLEKTGGTYIVGAHNVRFAELFRIMSATANIKAPARRVGYATAYLTTLALNIKSALTGRDPGITMSGIRTIRHPWFFNTEKAARELNFHPRPLRETIVDAVRWHMKRTNG